MQGFHADNTYQVDLVSDRADYVRFVMSQTGYIYQEISIADKITYTKIAMSHY